MAIATDEVVRERKLKYQSQIDVLSPTQEEWELFGELDNKKSFRWVFKDPSDIRNFTPRYSDPGVLELHKKKGALTCRGWALSFFDTQSNARDFLIRVTDDKKRMYLKLGTHIAEGIIGSMDGITELQCDKKGHFDHFEYVETDFYRNRFETIEEVFKDE